MIEKLNAAIERGWDDEVIYVYFMFKARGGLNEKIICGMIPAEEKKWLLEFQKTSRWLVNRLPRLREKMKSFYSFIQTQMKVSRECMVESMDYGMFNVLFSSIYDTHMADKLYGKLVCDHQMKQKAKERLLEKLPTLFTVTNMTLASHSLSVADMGRVLDSLQRMNKQLELYASKDKSFDRKIHDCLNESHRLTAMYTK